MTSTMTRQSARRPKAAATWVPREHGAWSWLISPVIAGAIVGGPHLHQLPLLGVALAGYLFFNAASLWAKMPPARRGQALRPMLVYGLVSALLTITLILMTGWTVVGWLGLMLVPLALAFLLTLRGAGRSLGSGLATALSSSALTLVAIQPDPSRFLRDYRPEWGWAFVLVYGLTACTLFAVKSMIRERSSNRFLAASIGWHVAWVLATAVGAVHGLPWVWPAFFAVATTRSAALPLYVRANPLKPMVLGLVELGFTLVLLGLLVWPGVS